MNVKPIDALLKSKVLEIIAEGLCKAEKQYGELMSKCIGLNHFEKSKIIVEEGEKIDGLESASEYPFYEKNYSSEDILLHQYSNRILLLGIDEADQLLESCISGEI